MESEERCEVVEAKPVEVVEFKERLETLLVDAATQGCLPSEIDSAASSVLAEYSTRKAWILADVFIKVFLVVFCSICAAAIYAWKAYALYTLHRIPSGDWFDFVCWVLVLSAAGQFFDVPKYFKLMLFKIRGR